ncbi:CBS domain-containing protein [Paraliomyxa miuraensis]|uniref:CBS domain-containing protein n=1 Tax=Paraliomyxa miuraensis TaxID=376150 RepID=UPI002255C3DB|nr:CBS domain-containing protein [Paraliomyxa miuraensis]MCX4247167.1 CBS domain-containing protein [Paraliomyxa miuraensis]
MDATRVATVMTPFPYSVDAREDLRTALAMMKQHGIRHLPVMREGKLEGIVSERDLEVALGVLGERDPEVTLPVWSVCQREPVTVELDASMVEVAEAMANEHIGSVLVMRKGKLAGIITTVDVCRAYGELLRGKDLPDEPA